LWCAYIKQPEANGEIAAGVSDNQPNEIVNVLPPAVKMKIERAHAILGHPIKDKTRWTTAALNMLITIGTLKTCKSCVISKEKQKNLNQESERAKASKFNGQVYRDIATMKEGNEDKKLCQKTVRHITAEETVNFKRSTFFVYKSDMPKDMCTFIQQEKGRGHPIEIIGQDNAGKK
jgi:hypothetical protein